VTAAAIGYGIAPSLLLPDAGYEITLDARGYGYRCIRCFRPCCASGFGSRTDALTAAEGHQERRHPTPPAPRAVPVESVRRPRWWRR
jgi:hypothetical protein